MKKVILVITALLFVTSIADAADIRKNQQQIQQNDQYQIVPVEYSTLSTNGITDKKAVLKINVFTGKTWILRDDTYRTSDGRIVANRGWEELEFNVDTKDPSR